MKRITSLLLAVLMLCGTVMLSSCIMTEYEYMRDGESSYIEIDSCRYHPVDSYEYVRLGKIIGHLKGYGTFIFTIDGDADMKFIQPYPSQCKTFCLLVRSDVVLPTLGENEIEKIWYSNEERGLDADGETARVIISAYSGEATDMEFTYSAREIPVYIVFKGFPQIKYRAFIDISDNGNWYVNFNSGRYVEISPISELNK